MPGAPNRPPATAPPEAAAPPGEAAGRAVLRRLAPSRVALNLDLWKGAPSGDLLVPFERAETAFQAGDWNGAQSALDQLAVRFAEPRWPTLPLPFRELRVSIPAPQPPQWDPEHALPAADKETRRLRREAEKQLALAKGSLAWMTAHGASAEDLAEPLAAAEGAYAAEGPSAVVWETLDRLWVQVRARVPAPRAAGSRPPPPPSPA
ncbi:MAG TPA: hypothetical protein VFG07_00135 [Thermoplasmata archaeon]|nr:hypothetical protein [Thermoplasmata archaeon]